MLIFLILLMLGGFLLAAWSGTVKILRRGSNATAVMKCQRVSGSLLMSAGAICFLGHTLAVSGGLNFLPATFEFPMGFTTDAVRDDSERIYCPKTDLGRIQVYDSGQRFVRGWFVDAGGGSFQLQVKDDGGIVVATARGQKLFLYDSEGRLLSQSSYVPKSYDDFDSYNRESLYIDTPLLLLPFSSIWFGVPMVMLGM